MKNIPHITDAEHVLMKIIWENYPINTNEIVEQLEGKTEWSPKTIHTMLMRLVKRGVLSYNIQKRIHTYFPVYPRDAYKERERDIFVDRYFSGNLGSMILNIIDNEKLSEKDISELKQILDAKGKG